MCKPIMKIIRKKLYRMAADKTILPKTEIYDAVHYMLGEWDALMNIFKRGDRTPTTAPSARFTTISRQ